MRHRGALTTPLSEAGLFPYNLPRMAFPSTFRSHEKRRLQMSSCTHLDTITVLRRLAQSGWRLGLEHLVDREPRSIDDLELDVVLGRERGPAGVGRARAARQARDVACGEV
jgi:hypothetical protein